MANVKPKAGGPYSLFCSDCGCWVPNTANHEMKKEGAYAHNHTCHNGVCDMKNGEKKFNPFYESDFLIAHVECDEHRYLVELTKDELLQLRSEIDSVLQGMAK